MIGTKVATQTLRNYHKKLASELRKSEENAGRLREALMHIEAVLKILEPGSSIQTLTAARKRPTRFPRGEPTRLTLRVLRESNEPLTTKEIAERACHMDGREPDAKTLANMKAAVRDVVNNHRGKTITPVPDLWPRRWLIVRETP